jgi:hypothetical protein
MDVLAIEAAAPVAACGADALLVPPLAEVVGAAQVADGEGASIHGSHPHACGPVIARITDQVKLRCSDIRIPTEHRR